MTNGSTTPLGVYSEVGRLKQVILHRPGRELARLTPSNKDALLFDDVLWVEKAQEEHDEFAQLLRDRGITVHLLQDLLAETLANDDATDFVLDRILDDRQARLGASLSRIVAKHLHSLDPAQRAEVLVCGLNKVELASDLGPRSLGLSVLADHDFVLAPLPNHLFTRDTSCWVYNGVSINPMKKTARRRETVHYEAIYRWHPMFAGRSTDERSFENDGFHIWFEGEAMAPATIEGGDVEVVGNGVVLIGLSERTTPAGVELLTRDLFAKGSAKKVIAVELPKGRAMMHLDTVMTQVNRATFTLYAGLLPERLRSFVLTPNEDTSVPHIEKAGDFLGALGEALEIEKVNIIQADQDAYAAEREQWNDGCNGLTLSPDVVVTYERNRNTIGALEAAGVEVIAIRGNELGRGRGGARCMSCPIEREGS